VTFFACHDACPHRRCREDRDLGGTRRRGRETTMLGPIGRLSQGIAAGCTGIVALEIVSYLDQYRRARPASESPARLGRALADRAEIDLGEGEAATNRASALGPLFGYSDGLLLGIAAASLSATPGRSMPSNALLLAAGAWLGSNGPLMALGLTDPRTWTRQEWVTDLVPHAAYGLATAAAVALTR
jgi:hypothetical protein